MFKNLGIIRGKKIAEYFSSICKYFVSKRKFKIAMKAIDLAIKYDSTKSFYYEQKAMLLKENMLYYEALKYYRLGLKLDPKCLNFYLEMGRIYLFLKRYNDAYELLKSGSILGSDKCNYLIIKYQKEFLVELRLLENPISKQDEKPQNAPPRNLEVPKKKLKHSLWINQELDNFDNYYSLSDLLIIKGSSEIRYGDLLKSFEWNFKRIKILFRDKYACKDCGERNVLNHVHHKYYIKDKLPWDIEDLALETLCRNCHIKRHKETDIPVYRMNGNNKIEVSRENPSCSRCGGTGYLPQFKHIENGICFKCEGNLIGRNVFEKGLDKIYDQLNNYNDFEKRFKYRYFIRNVSENEFIEKYPDYSGYINKTIVEDYNNDFDELPF